ncbi:hypothetical protein C8J56DRAFT_784126, partial [Mycena floridula]
HCQKKPKYQNFDFCGKNCAALAGSKTSPAIAVQSKPMSPLASNGSAAPQKLAALDTVQITSRFEPLDRTIKVSSKQASQK